MKLRKMLVEKYNTKKIEICWGKDGQIIVFGEFEDSGEVSRWLRSVAFPKVDVLPYSLLECVVCHRNLGVKGFRNGQSVCGKCKKKHGIKVGERKRKLKGVNSEHPAFRRKEK